MGNKNLDEYLELVNHEFFTLRIEWRLYRSLFGTNKETVDLMNEVSGLTAQTLERVLFDRCLLGLRRLTDESQGKRSSSVTVKGFLSRVGNDDIHLKRIVREASAKCQFAKNWSDKRIAHSDLDYRLGKAKLESANRKKVEEALDALAAVIKWVSHKYFERTQITHPIPPINDERLFLRALYLGAEAVRQEKELKEQLLRERRYKELDAMVSWHDKMPDWLRRDDPPIDVD